ncbi:alpha-amylase family glycosyl hydrolase [Nonlabens xiamenensis]|uniref:alpha-amylase family glycosyl hydrolase n=1 Tax=Nonlabens xiamenensis TaxID=2341043 RepID=UPI000F614903|nr:alpha-amylase family glycosyl hydrolase [Nonlabens xiamenensis]
MNKYILGFVLMIALWSCKEEKEAEPAVNVTEEEGYRPIKDSDLENAVIYEANIRQYSPEGTLDAFTKDIPQLKELGVKIIWVMPVFPISEKNRKAKGDLMVEDIKDPEERKKYLGSYYAIADYEAINPEFGTMEDFNELVQTAHDNGMFVIMDWVANHTGWDHKWMEKHQEYYTRNAEGEITHPIGTDWTDTADLDYGNLDLWEDMSSAMLYWVKKHDIDGFRCDVAHEVPTEFWDYATTLIEKEKPVFMLAESEKKDLFKKSFDMGYNWEGHHIMNNLAQGKASVEKWDAYMEKVEEEYEEDDILMNFITNHDENSWNGTVQERMGQAHELMLSMSYTIPGMPLIYSGQEYGLDHRLKFFEKDSIPKEKGRVWEAMKRLGQLKAENPALHGGKNAAAYKRLKTSDDEHIYAFERSKDGHTVYFVANISDEKRSPVIYGMSGEVRVVMQPGPATLTEEMVLDLPPYRYRLFEKIVD